MLKLFLIMKGFSGVLLISMNRNKDEEIIKIIIIIKLSIINNSGDIPFAKEDILKAPRLFNFLLK